MTTKRTFEVILVGTDGEVTAVKRLGSLLKTALRAFGLKCSHVREVKSGSTDEPIAAGESERSDGG